MQNKCGWRWITITSCSCINIAVHLNSQLNRDKCCWCFYCVDLCFCPKWKVRKTNDHVLIKRSLLTSGGSSLAKFRVFWSWPFTVFYKIRSGRVAIINMYTVKWRMFVCEWRTHMCVCDVCQCVHATRSWRSNDGPSNKITTLLFIDGSVSVRAGSNAAVLVSPRSTATCRDECLRANTLWMECQQ